ncbi:uncharacterized protein LOC111062421 [Nilaparvata lugens]|uniref:uncharacterized protein LOC111062421 n=1 Tax=Nilaparvata lugens TaxID=108931 RepID=UPI00193DAB66|nr:uncharacterized protein LOC111062421 [Nilaparvata lugens]
MINFEILITHVESVGSVLKICGQEDFNTGLYVEKHLNSLRESFERGDHKISSVNQLVPNLVCCARLNNSKYFRVKIINVSGTKACVSFIDYGKTGKIEISDLRLLDHSSVQNLCTLDPLVSEYFLAYARPLTGYWDENWMQFIRKELMNKSFTCFLLADARGKRFIAIDYKSEDFAEFLVKSEYADKITIEAQAIQIEAENDIRAVKFCAPPPMTLPASMVPQKPHVNIYQQPRPAFMPSQSMSRNVLPPSGSLLGMAPPQMRNHNIPNHQNVVLHQQVVVPASTPRFVCEGINENSEHSVFIAHVESTRSFTVQLKIIAETTLLNMMKRLNSLRLAPVSGHISPGFLCLGRFTVDKTFYRAVVVGLEDDKCKVFYVDFGNTELLPLSEMFQLPEEFQGEKVMGHRFALANIKSMNITPEFDRLFIDYVKNKAFLMRVTTPEEQPSTKQFCELYYQGRNIKEIINEMLRDAYSKATLPARGTTVRVFVSHVETVTKIFVQLLDEQDTLTNLMSKIAEHCNDRSLTFYKPSQLKPGMPVCAYYCDDQWYRAKILSVDQNEAKVLFVDYGNIDSVEISKLRYISPDLVGEVDAQAIECCLAGYETSEPDEALDVALYNLITEKAMSMKVYGILIDDVLAVEFFDDNNAKISSFLQSTRLAGFSQPEAVSVTAVPQPAAVHASADEWKENVEESLYEEPAPFRTSKGRIGSGRILPGHSTPKSGTESKSQSKPTYNDKNHNKGSLKKIRFNDRDDFDSGKSRSFNSDNQKFNRRANQEDDYSNQRGGGGRFDKQRDDDFGDRSGGGGGENWRQKKDRDDSGSGAGWRNRDEDDYGKKSSFRGDDDRGGGSWRRRDNETSVGGDKRSGGGGFQSKGGGGGSWRSRDGGDSNDGESSWRARGSDSSRNDNFKSQKYGNFSSGPRYGGDGESSSGYKGKSGAVQSSVKEGDFCIAQYKEDEVWYRALVKSSSFGNMTVQFIDYGNSEEVTADQIKEITSELCTLPAQAVKCCLLGASGDEWSDQKLTEFSLATDGKTLDAHIMCKDFSTDSLKVILRDLSNPDEEVVINYQFGATDEVLNSITPPTPGEVVSWSPFPVELGSQLEVQIPWLVTPHLLYVQPLFCNAHFRQMMEHLNHNVKSFTLLTDNEQSVGKSVVTYFKEDKAVYRAIIKENGKVIFVDYGNDEQIDSKHTWAVEPEYSAMPCQAVQCSLAGVRPVDGDAWPAPRTTKLESFFEADSYLCTFHSITEDGKLLVTLEVNGVSVADQLIENQLASLDETTIPQPEESSATGIQLSMLPSQVVRAKVVSVKDTSTIYVQLLPQQALTVREQIAAVVESDCLKKLEKDNVLPGTICIIKSEENSYHRALVWNIDDEANLTVELIDQGGCINIGMDEVYDIPKTVSMEPGLAYDCTFKPKDEDLTKMKDDYENKSLILYVKSSEVPNRLCVSVYDTNGNAVSELIDGEIKNMDVICPLPILQKRQKMVISHVEKGAVYLQRKDDEVAITDLISKLYDHYEAAELGSNPGWATGMMCAAKSSADDQWYRAHIASLEDDLANVHYVDYGNSELISPERIAVLDESFLADNMYAVKVALPVQWALGEENLLDHFAEKVFDTHFLRVNDSWLVNMIDGEGVELVKKIEELELGTEMEDSPFKKVQVPSRISKFTEGATFSVCRDHVLSPSQFWVVLSDDFEKVEALQDRLQSLATHLRPITKNSLAAHKSKVAARFADDIWYRASYNSEADTVFSVDYGNTESCTGQLKELPEDLIEEDDFAIECALNVQPVKESDWDSETKSLFDSLIPDDELALKVLKNNGSTIVVDLIVKNESLSKMLISKELAIEPPITAYISHITSPSDFYIQEEDNHLEKISKQLIAAGEFAVIENVQLKKEGIFAAQYSYDGLWYRARYLENIYDSGAKVLFVDYGNTDDAQHFRELPEELASLPFSAKHCSLFLKDSFTDWSEVVGAKERFEELSGSGSTAFELQIVSEGDPTIVNLLTDGHSVSDTLTRIVNQETQEDEELTLRTKAIVSHINSPSDFYVQFENSPLESVSSQLMNADKWDVLTNVEENSLVAALFEDSVWYRAQVLSKSDNEVTVMFIDYGNVAPALEVRELPEDLKEVAPLAEHCRLKLPLGVLEWSQESIDQFSEMLGYGTVPVEINFLTSNDVPKTVQLTVNDEDVAKSIAKFCESKIIVECSDKGKNVVVCHINSPKDFFVHSDLEAVDEMATKLLAAKSFETCDSENLVGLVVAACFKEDEQWYRAKVISKSEDGSGYEVQFIDYGNTSVSDEFLKLSSDLIDIPALAKWCCLNSLRTFSPEATDKFRDLAMDGVQEFEMIIIDEYTTPIKVDLIFNGQQLNEILPSVELGEEYTDDLSQAKVKSEEPVMSDEIENLNTDNEESTNKVSATDEDDIEDNLTLAETEHDIENSIELDASNEAAKINSKSNEIEALIESGESKTAEENSASDIVNEKEDQIKESGEYVKTAEENSASDIVNEKEDQIKESGVSIKTDEENSTSNIVNEKEDQIKESGVSIKTTEENSTSDIVNEKEDQIKKSGESVKTAEENSTSNIVNEKEDQIKESGVSIKTTEENSTSDLIVNEMKDAVESGESIKIADETKAELVVPCKDAVESDLPEATNKLTAVAQENGEASCSEEQFNGSQLSSKECDENDSVDGKTTNKSTNAEKSMPSNDSKIASALPTETFENGQTMKTKKIPFSEKIVPGAVSSGRKLELEEEDVD